MSTTQQHFQQGAFGSLLVVLHTKMFKKILFRSKRSIVDLIVSISVIVATLRGVQL
jgi:hypothetical protein